jgi:putative ABC transport system permease protein
MVRARILLAAIKARRGAAAVLFVVAVLAIAAAAIGPMFLHSADTSVLTSTAKAAPPGESDLTIISSGGAGQMSQLSSAVRASDHVANGLLSQPLFAADVGSHFVYKNQAYGADVLARTGICAHLTFVSGACPQGLNEVAISKRSTTTSDIRVGTHLDISESHSSTMTEVTISGIYLTPTNIDNNYWKDNYYFDFGDGGPADIQLDPLVATFNTVLATSSVANPQLTADVAWRSGATLSGASALVATAAKIKSLIFSHYSLTVTTGLSSVINAAQLDDDLMSTVVLAIVLQLIVLSLLILYTLGRATILGRRQESEFARRHGFPRSALIMLAVGEPAALIVAALPAGVLLAWGVLAVLTKTLFASGTPVSFPGIAIVCAVGACVAGVVAMTIASSELWRSRALNNRQAALVGFSVDAFAFALALTGLVSLVTKGSLSGSHANPLALLAPGLLALGAGVLGLRLAALAIKAVIARSAESSRVGWFLALRQIGRRPTVLRQLLPITAAAAVVLFAVGSYFLASANRSEVASFDVGTARVADVTPPPGFDLESAVRRADPSGHEAMAGAYYSSSTGDLLAVDSSRLAAVGFWPTALSHQSLADLARKLSPVVPPGVSFQGDTLRLTLGVAKGTPPIELGVDIFDGTYLDSKTVYLGPVVAGVHSYTLSLTGICPGACRLTGLVPNWVNPYNPYSKRVLFDLDGVAVQAKGAWHNVTFGAGKKATWSVSPSSIHVDSSASGTVSFDIPGTQLQSEGLLLSPIDLPAAIPALVTIGDEELNPPTPPGRDSQLNIDGSLLNVKPLVVVPTLPYIGNGGSLIDYVFAQRAVTASDSGVTYQVWLAPSASPKILQRLSADGVTIGPISLASQRLGVLDHGGIALAYAVALFASPIAALLAIGTVAFVIVSDGRRRRREFASLSMAGVPMHTVRRALLLENAVVLGVALLVGAVIGFVTDTLAFSSLPEFVRGTGGLPISKAVPILPFLGAIGVLAVLLACTVELTTRSVIRGSRPRQDEGSME